MKKCKGCNTEFAFLAKSKCSQCRKNTIAAKNLYNLLDAICGIVSEQGWDGIDRYTDSGYSIFVLNVELLRGLDKNVFRRFLKEAKSYGMLDPQYV